jgi:hypothetical protein
MTTAFGDDARRTTREIPEPYATIFRRMWEGESVRAIFKSKPPEWPVESTFWLHVSTDSDLAKAYEVALQRRAERYAEEIVELSDAALVGEIRTETTGGKDGDTTKVVTRDNVERAKLMVDARKWVASRLLSKRYGDRVTLSGDDSAPLVHSFDDLARKLSSLAPGDAGAVRGDADRGES